MLHLVRARMLYFTLALPTRQTWLPTEVNSDLLSKLCTGMPTVQRQYSAAWFSDGSPGT